MSTQSRPFSRVGTVPLLWLHQELPLLWAKDRKECGLVSRIIKLHTAYSSRVCPVLVGFRAALGPGGLRLPLMRIIIRSLNYNSSLILLCLQNPCWPTRRPGRSTQAPSASARRALTSVGLGAKASCPSSFGAAQGFQDGIKHQFTPPVEGGGMKVRARDKNPNKKKKRKQNTANSILSAVDIKDCSLARPAACRPQWYYC